MRKDFELISEWIAPQSSVLDLGCGDGTLLDHLKNSHNIRGIGLEIDVSNISLCIERGVDVIHVDLDSGEWQKYFADQEFDYVVMTHALQIVKSPEETLLRMIRIGREAIVTFPNFAYWKNRFQLGMGGRMPVTDALPSQWYDTANIHLCTFKDFENLCRLHNIACLQYSSLNAAHKFSLPARYMRNLFGEIAMYRLTKHAFR